MFLKYGICIFEKKKKFNFFVIVNWEFIEPTINFGTKALLFADWFMKEWFYQSVTQFCLHFNFHILVGHVKCNWDSLWASIWSKATPHDGHLLAKVLAYQCCYCNYLAPCLYLLSFHLQATRRGRWNIRCCWIYFIMVHSNSLLFRFWL